MRAIAVLVLLAGSALVSAQSAASGPPPAFEVASVKPNNSGASGSSSYTGKGRLTATNVQLRLLIAQAYGIPSNRIAAPNWIDSARFDINARALENTPDSQTNLMLRSLLVDRFKLTARTEMRDQPIYALVVADKGGTLGPFLQPAAECDKKPMMGAPSDARAVFPQAVLGALMPCGTNSSSNPTGTVMTGGAVTVADLARNLDRTADRPVADRTGLTGKYNLALRFARPNVQPVGGQDSELPVLFTALQEQLGLKLESARGPVEFLVIDRIEQPTPD